MHPLNGIELNISNYKGFGKIPTGFTSFKPINIIIGRNNTGKSALIDTIQLCLDKGKSFSPLKHGRNGNQFEVVVTQKIDEGSLSHGFPSSGYGGEFSAFRSYWDYGKQFLGSRISRAYGLSWKPEFRSPELFTGMTHTPQFRAFLHVLPWPFADIELIRIAAERDVQPEERNGSRAIQPNGVGTTNLISAFITSDSLRRDTVEVELLEDLNTIYLGDNHFTRISVREDETGIWEIFLREESKGDIRLSQSGSSLKSIFIILAMMRLIPEIREVKWEKVILAIEEPENNLHPALLRRLLHHLAQERENLEFTLIITTHSPICIDWSTSRNDSQILHVQNKDGASLVKAAVSYREGADILDDLDVRASDILQANGIIWVEGPSDRIYVKRWIELISSGHLVEGVHYTIMFYGGKVLAHFDGLPPSESKELVSLMALNRNAALLMDSDRHLGEGATKTGRTRKPRMNLNSTKTRIKQEFENIGAFVWVTKGREVENYISATTYARILDKPTIKIGEYDDLPSLAMFKDFKENKVAIAHAIAPKLIDKDIDYLDLKPQLTELAARVRKWNAIA